MKKILAIIIAIMMTVSMMTTVYAAEDDGSGKKDVGEHEHILMDMANAACHYSECTICFELFNVGDHTFENGKCTVCGHSDPNPQEEIRGEGEHEHILMDMANAACHYSECTVCFELFNVGDHTFENGKCTVCGHPELINPFEDVAEEAWYNKDVIEAVKTGIINGKSATEFRPDDLLTYAEAIKLAACMNQVYLNGEVTLAGGTPWYKPYADYCKANGITSKDYNYDDKVTRADYMEIFANALPNSAFAEINDIPDGCIPDVDDDAYYVYKLYRAGIVTGVDELHSCNPDANIKRSEVATIIARMMDDTKRKQFDMEAPVKEEIAPVEDEEEEEIVEKLNVGDLNSKEDDEIINKTETITVNTQPSEEVAPLPDVDINKKYESTVVDLTPEVTVTPTNPVDAGEQLVLDTPLTIHKQPKGSDEEKYGSKYELEVQVFGGKAPYTYEWYYNGYKNQKTKIENGDYVKDAQSEALILSVEKENTLLGAGIFCKITDADGCEVTTDRAVVYGPFSMPVEDWTLEDGTNTLIGRVNDGKLKAGDKVSVIRNGKVIAIGTAKELQMFGKSLDEAVKNDNIGLVFDLEEGARPQSGDIAVKYQPSHVVDTSDIIN